MLSRCGLEGRAPVNKHLICNRQSFEKSRQRGVANDQQNAILRYSRLQICATGDAKFPLPQEHLHER
jgi:hypothetical protein